MQIGKSAISSSSHENNNVRIVRIKKAKFLGYCFYMNTNIQGDFQICISVPSTDTKSFVALCKQNMCQVYSEAANQVFSLRKGVLKICIKFTGEHPYQNVVSIKLQSSFIEIALRHVCSAVNLLHVFRTPFSRNTSGQLLLLI